MKNSEMRQYCKNTLGLDNPFVYFQAGVLVFNVLEMNKVITVDKLLEMSDTWNLSFFGSGYFECGM